MRIKRAERIKVSFNTYNPGKGFGKKDRPQMNNTQARTAILAYKGETFRNIEALIKKVESDNRPSELSRTVARVVLNTMKLDSTKPFTIPN